LQEIKINNERLDNLSLFEGEKMSPKLIQEIDLNRQRMLDGGGISVAKKGNEAICKINRSCHL
jgi:hypothetical protein